MDQSAAMAMARQGVEVALLAMMPILAVSLFIGVLVSILQALTQIQEMTLTFVPKLVGVAVVMAAVGNWMLGVLINFTVICFSRVGNIGHGG